MYKLQRHQSLSIPIAGLLVVFVTTIAMAAETIPRSEASTETVAEKVAPWLDAEFLVSMGYRVDDLNWNIAGDICGNDPNILSELTWSDLETRQLKLHNKTIIREVFYLRGSLAYGWIFDGDNQDSDYVGDNRTLEFSRSNNSADDGTVLDLSLGIGYQFKLGSDLCGIVPLIGYSFHDQNLTITDGNQTIPPTGPFPGLSSTYKTEWKGPWLGLDLNFYLHQVELSFGIEHHWANYEAAANWNLREDFAHPKSFEHDADGSGVVISAACNIFFDKHWALNLNCDYQDWSTDHGTDRVFFANGTSSDTRLNEVNWTSRAIMMGIVYRY